MRLGVALGVSAVMVAGMVGTAAASVESKGNKQKFCKQAGNVSYDVDSSGDLSEENAAALEKALNKLSKVAPTKAMKQSTSTMADYFGELADGTDPEDVSPGDYEDYGIAAGKFGIYLVTKCLDVALPDITLPDDIDVPDITLPDFDLPDLNS
jgi:hypothetical protein